MKNSKCWANSLNDCCEKITREHIISEGVLPDLIDIQGFSWCTVAKTNFPKARLVSKILCETHNSRLSLLDSSAIEISKQFKQFKNLSDERRKVVRIRNRKFARLQLNMDARLFERWLLKTLCNLATCQPSSTGNKWWPPEDLVTIIFGFKPIGINAGAGMPVVAGAQLQLGPTFAAAPLRKFNEIVGLAIDFHGHPFVCTWHEPVAEMDLPSIFRPAAKPTRRPKKIEILDKVNLSIKIKLPADVPNEG